MAEPPPPAYDSHVRLPFGIPNLEHIDAQSEKLVGQHWCRPIHVRNPGRTHRFRTCQHVLGYQSHREPANLPTARKNPGKPSCCFLAVDPKPLRVVAARKLDDVLLTHGYRPEGQHLPSVEVREFH